MTRDLSADPVKLVFELRDRGLSGAEAAALCAAAAGYITGLLPAECQGPAAQHLVLVFEHHRRKAVGEKAMAETLEAMLPEGRAS